MPDDFKRNIAYKIRIGEIEKGKPVMDGERFSLLELGEKKIVRVNVVGVVIDKYKTDGEKKYLFLTLDDGSGQIKTKAFGEDSEKFSSVSQGQTIISIGTLRYFNNEIYISPETIKPVDSKYLIVRKLETEGDEIKVKLPVKSGSELRDRIVELIKTSDSRGGIEISALVSGLNSEDPEGVNSEIQRLLEEGVIFEPRPGVIRWLG